MIEKKLYNTTFTFLNMEPQRTHTLMRRHPQWGRVFLTVTLVILGTSIAQDRGSASLQSHAAAPLPANALLSVVNHPNIRSDHQILLSNTIRALPGQCQASLRNLYVRYDRPNERGLAGKGTIILSGNVRNAELRALFVHEFGHITDLGCLSGTPESGPSLFHDGPEIIFQNDPSTSFYRISWVQETTRKLGSSPEDFVSGYAAKDAFEDFAETFAYFVLQPEAFKTRAQGNIALQKKWTWMQEYVFQKTPSIASGKPWNNVLPWDVTKIFYTWHGEPKNVVYSLHASASNPRRPVDSQ
ncbi:hypothetical protein A3H90_00970 [Candidatus Peribacteria bacterium RIFCSPLOWO2_02_FULL_55_36]|nr:MAG: hypothetical protein A3H90_00970 [Candidatus Peribacteria bacterium RIFCSPLOWO2_02_FULL_55_36]